MASTNQQITANLYQVFATDTTGNISTLGISNISTGNITANGNVTLGAISNVHITGGTSGQLLTTDGAGNLSFVTISAATGNVAGLNLNGLGNTYLAGNGAWLTFPTSSYGNIVNTNYSGNGQQVLAGNGVWVAQPTGNIGNTNYSGNASQYLNGAGQWTGIPGSGGGNIGAINLDGNVSHYLNGLGQWSVVPGSGGGNIGTVNLNGSPSTVLAGDGTWKAYGNVAPLNLNGNTFTYLNGAGLWANIPAGTGGSNVPNLNGNSQTVLNGAGQWVPATSGGNVGALNLSGNPSTYLSGTGSWQPIGNVAVSNFSGNAQTYLNGIGQWVAISGNGGSGPAGSNSWIQYNLGGGFGANSTFTFDQITDTVKATKLSADGLMNVHYATEGITLNSIAPVGTYNLDVLTNGIHYTTAVATANLVLNIRANATTSLNSILGVGNSITMTYLMTSGATGYIVNTFSVDGNSVTPNWAGNIKPTTVTNSMSSYMLTVIKTSATPTYKVLASITQYQ